MNEELAQKIEALVQAVTLVAQKVDELAERVDQLDSVLFDGLIGPMNDQIAEDEYNEALSDFRCKFGEKLDKYDALAKEIEGDDEFDSVKRAFDTYNENEDINGKMSPAEYVDRVAEGFAEKAKAIEEKAKALAAIVGDEVTVEAETPDGKIEVTADENGNTETKAEGEVESKAEDKVEEKPAEKPTEEPKEEYTEETEEKPAEEEDSRAKWRKVAEELDDKLF